MEAFQFVLSLYQLGISCHDFGCLAVQAQTDIFLLIRILGYRFLDTPHDKFKMRDIILFFLINHQKFMLAGRCTMQAMSAIKHEYFERCNAKFIN